MKRRLKLTKLGRKVFVWLLIIIMAVLAIPLMKTEPCYPYNIFYMCCIVPLISCAIASLN